MAMAMVMVGVMVQVHTGYKMNMHENVIKL
jgi:hypothetical protein